MDVVNAACAAATRSPRCSPAAATMAWAVSYPEMLPFSTVFATGARQQAAQANVGRHHNGGGA